MLELDMETERIPKKAEAPRGQLRQPPSVPFIWEERPGLPKKNWTPSLATFVPSPPTLPPPVSVPVNLVTSVPFVWEETPGKPLPSSVDAPPQLPDPPLENRETGSHPPWLPPPVPLPPLKLVTSVPFIWEETPGQPYPCFVDVSSEQSDQPLELARLPLPPMYANNDDDVGSEADTSSDTYDDASSNSFSSVPSLLAANCLVSLDSISSAVPVDGFNHLNRQTDSMPPSPAYESDDSTSSYMTGASSLMGSSFLEKLFPRIPQDSGLVQKLDADPKDVAQVSHPLPDMNIGFPVRKPATLGELIMLSRRRSYMRRAVELRKQNPSQQEFTKNGDDSCCLFVPGIKMIEGLEWKKFQPKQKLM